MGVWSDEGDRCKRDVNSWGWLKGSGGRSVFIGCGGGEIMEWMETPHIYTCECVHTHMTESQGIQLPLSRCCPGKFHQSLGREGRAT